MVYTTHGKGRVCLAAALALLFLTNAVTSTAWGEEGMFEIQIHHSLMPAKPDQEVKTPEGGIGTLAIGAARGEYEMAAFAVKSTVDIEGLHVEVGDLANGNNLISGSTIRVHYVLPEKVNIGPKDNKQMANLPNWFMPNERAGMKLLAGQAASFYITVKIPLDAPAGKYAGEVTVASNSLMPKRIPFVVTVLPFTLVKPHTVFSMLYTYEFRFLERWDPDYQPKSKIRWEGKEDFIARGSACVTDMAEHGMTNIFPHSATVVLRKKGEICLTEFGMSMKTAAYNGMKGTPGWFVGTMLNAQWHDLQSFNEERDCALFKEIVVAAGKTAKENGFDDCILVPADEPKISVPEKLVVAKKLLAAGKSISKDNHVKIGLTSDYETLKSIPELYDIGIIAGGTPEQWQEIQKSGHELWIYDNNAACGHTPAWSRFIYGFYGWRTGLDGITSWTYPLDIDDWDGRKRQDANGNGIPKYDANGTPINSLVWEAIREGIEDRRYIDTLQEKIAECQQKGKKDVAAEAEKLLSDLKQSIPADLKEYKYVNTERGEPSPGDKFPPEWFEQTKHNISEMIIKLSNAAK